MRGFIMPSFIHSFKLAHDCKIAVKPLGVLITAVILISVVVSWFTAVRLGYENGGLQLGLTWWAQTGASSPAGFVENLTRSSAESVWQNWLWLGVGAVLTWGMMLARSRLLWFPLHPLGYLISFTYSTKQFWPSIFVGWLCKVLITRFGGVDSYRQVTPAFLGLVLGDVTMILFWLIVDGWQGRTGHQLMPG